MRNNNLAIYKFRDVVEVAPSAVVTIPLVVIAAHNRQWAFYLLLGTIPFFALSVFAGLSHVFRLPEIMLIVFIGHYLIGWMSEKKIKLRNSIPIILLWAFIGAATLGVLLAVFRPTSVMVHPVEATFQSRLFVEPSVNMKNISQLLLRLFFVLGVTVLALSLYVDRRIENAIRYLVAGAIFVGLSGVLYQLIVVLDMPGTLSVLTSIGFLDLPAKPGSLGPLPRMYSTVGEPGFTADYLLYAFGLSLTLAILPGSTKVCSQREAILASLLIFGFLLMSTATTGYGGLLILLGVIATVLILIQTIRPDNLGRLILLSAGGAIIGGLVLVLFSGGLKVDIAARQIEKMAFQTGSGTIRLFYMKKSLVVFLERPFFGVGVGTHHAPSYMFTLLAETGIFGTMTLIGAHLVAFRQCTGLLAESGSRPSPLIAAILIAGLTLLLTNLIAKSISSLLLPWYWFGLALAIAVVARDSDSVGNLLEEGDVLSLNNTLDQLTDADT